MISRTVRDEAELLYSDRMWERPEWRKTIHIHVVSETTLNYIIFSHPKRRKATTHVHALSTDLKSLTYGTRALHEGTYAERKSPRWL